MIKVIFGILFYSWLAVMGVLVCWMLRQDLAWYTWLGTVTGIVVIIAVVDGIYHYIQKHSAKNTPPPPPFQW